MAGLTTHVTETTLFSSSADFVLCIQCKWVQGEFYMPMMLHLYPYSRSKAAKEVPSIDVAQD